MFHDKLGIRTDKKSIRIVIEDAHYICGKAIKRQNKISYVFRVSIQLLYIRFKAPHEPISPPHAVVQSASDLQIWQANSVVFYCHFK